MAELRINIGPDRLTVDDVILLEEAKGHSMRQLRDLIARYVVADDGSEVTPEDALALVGRLTMTELNQTLEAMGEALQEAQADAVDPPTSGES